jgi:pimeloyl-ACP methyl ester carboxylesterase
MRPHYLLQHDILFLVVTAEAVIVQFYFEKFHLIGHSMGGLAALLLAHEHPNRILSFVDIKGNLAPEGCFLSRQIFEFPSDCPKYLLEMFPQRCCASSSLSGGLYAITLKSRVRAETVRPIFESMVRLSDEEDLLDCFLELGFENMFMYGEDNSELSYLGRLEEEVWS